MGRWPHPDKPQSPPPAPDTAVKKPLKEAPNRKQPVQPFSLPRLESNPIRLGQLTGAAAAVGVPAVAAGAKIAMSSWNGLWSGGGGGGLSSAY